MKDSTINTLILSVFSILILGITSCKEKYDCNKWVQQPQNDLFVVFERNDTILSNEDKKDYKLYCVIEGSLYQTYKHLVLNLDPEKNIYPHDSSNFYFIYNFAEYFSDVTENLNFFRHLELSYNNYDIDEFYLENTISGQIDTINISAEEVDACQALKEPCGCHNPIRSFKLNGEEVEKDEELTAYYKLGYPVYRLKVK